MNVTVRVNSSRKFILPYADDGRVTPATEEVWREVCAEMEKQSGKVQLDLLCEGRVCTMIFRYRQASDVSNLLTLIGLAAVAP